MSLAWAANAEKAKTGSKPVKGVTTPGVQVPFSNLVADAEFPFGSAWLTLADAVLAADPVNGSVARIDPKTNKAGDPIVGLKTPCGAVVAFGSLWASDCGDHSLARIDLKSGKVTATIPGVIGTANPSPVANSDSLWVLTDDRTTLARIDPQENRLVAEMRLPSGCNALAFGEMALWATCPSDNRVLRIDPRTNLVEKRIDVSAEPRGVAVGVGSVWVLCRKDGKVERIDPKTNKVTKTIDLSVPGANGSVAIGAGSVWVALEGFPLTRIDPESDKVVQQFYGEDAAVVLAAPDAIWLSSPHKGFLRRYDPKRIAATLPE
jgi:streptogramin lyase